MPTPWPGSCSPEAAAALLPQGLFHYLELSSIIWNKLRLGEQVTEYLSSDDTSVVASRVTLGAFDHQVIEEDARPPATTHNPLGSEGSTDETVRTVRESPDPVEAFATRPEDGRRTPPRHESFCHNAPAIECEYVAVPDLVSWALGSGLDAVGEKFRASKEPMP
jgi:hypothetical protein